MPDLRTLAQAVVDAWQEPAHMAKVYRSLEMLSHHLGDAGDIGVETARAILAALDAADAQGYARAMGEVVERCEEPAPRRDGSARLRMAHAAGWGNAMCHVADWAIARCE